MADATVTQGGREDSLALGAELEPHAAPRLAPAMPRPLTVLWAGMVVAMIAFLAAGSLRIGAGNWIGRRMPVRQVWSRFTGYLVDEGASAAIVLGVSAAAAVALVGAAIALWLAFALKDDPDPTSADASER